MRNLVVHLNFLSESLDDSIRDRSCWLSFIKDHLKYDNLTLTELDSVQSYLRKRYNATLHTEPLGSSQSVLRNATFTFDRNEDKIEFMLRYL